MQSTIVKLTKASPVVLPGYSIQVMHVYSLAFCWPLLTLNTLPGLSCIVLTQSGEALKSYRTW